MDPRHAISELVCESGMALDAKDFKAYLELCDPAYHYAITAYSPEIRKDMTWLEHDKAGMTTLFTNLPRHNSDHAVLTRQIAVCTVKVDEAARTARVASALTVYRTTLDGGVTSLFAVGKMLDTVNLAGDVPRLLDRNIRLDTRMLGFGFHIPF